MPILATENKDRMINTKRDQWIKKGRIRDDEIYKLTDNYKMKRKISDLLAPTEHTLQTKKEPHGEVRQAENYVVELIQHNLVDKPGIIQRNWTGWHKRSRVELKSECSCGGRKTMEKGKHNNKYRMVDPKTLNPITKRSELLSEREKKI